MISRLRNSFAGVFLLNFILATLFYLPSLHSKFVYDINCHIKAYERYGWRGIWTDWGETTIRWGIHCVNFLIWRFFGTSDTAWFIAFIALHALCAALVYRLLVILLDKISFNYSTGASLIAMLLFLLSPYHSETIVWGATIFYLTYSISLLGIILCFMRYAETYEVRYIALIYLLLLYGMLTFEVFLITPLILLVLYFLLLQIRITTLSFKRFFLLFIIPQVALTALYFLWNKLRMGQIVGHYGAAAHFHFDIWMLTSNFTKYMLKFSYIHLFFTYSLREKIYNHLAHHYFLLGVLGAYISVLAGTIFLAIRKKITPVWSVIIALFALFVLALAPVLNLYFPFNKDIEQERYLYVPALFFYPFLSVFLLSIFRKGAFAILAVALIVSVFFLHRNVYCWEQVGKINNGLIADFRWPNAKRIFVLLNGDNYCGAYMMRDMPQSSFAEMLHVQRHIDIDKRSYDILQYNILRPNDSCCHEIVDSNSIKITFGQWGNWFWYKSYGAHSYDSTLYNVKIDEWSHSFIVKFKDKRPDDVYIYQCNDKWVEVKGF